MTRQAFLKPAGLERDVSGHSFRIGGASFFLGQGISPLTVQWAGRWKSLAFTFYIRAYEDIIPKSLAI
ncbi:hypothetical protein BT69DRAFT_1285359 [Atractiella rhizophila]|nr:hypothetical protein BT69DRAFT_1285359 [Atractiella rhizophila]